MQVIQERSSWPLFVVAAPDEEAPIDWRQLLLDSDCVPTSERIGFSDWVNKPQ